MAELQEILSTGQSTISTHLAQLKQAGLAEDRRTGKHVLYRLKSQRAAQQEMFGQLLELLRRSAAEISETEQDTQALAALCRNYWPKRSPRSKSGVPEAHSPRE